MTAAILLAAGLSRRFGAANKLLAVIDGETVVARAARVLLAAEPALHPVVVVIGHEGERIRQALTVLQAGARLMFVSNPACEEGLSSSLRCGLEALPEGAEGALIALGDMPWLLPRHVERLLAAFEASGREGICVPMVGGRRGNPSLWAARFFAPMAAQTGDVGARGLFAEYGEHVREVHFAPDDNAVLLDVDSPERLEMLSRQHAATTRDGGNGTP